MRTYRSTRNGVTTVEAEPGSRADQRFAKSGRWRLIRDTDAVPDADMRDIERDAAAQDVQTGESGTFDGPRTAPRGDGSTQPAPATEPEPPAGAEFMPEDDPHEE